MIIGAGHAAQVGKDTLADILVKDHGFTRLAFADALKQLVYETMPSVSFLVDLYGWENGKTVYPAQVRQPLVDVGNAARRILGEDVWLNAVALQIESGRDYVISDTRYPNEVEWVKQHGIAVKITRPGFAPLSNVADQALADYADWDHTIDNDGSVDDFAAKVDKLLQNIRLSEENL